MSQPTLHIRKGSSFEKLKHPFPSYKDAVTFAQEAVGYIPREQCVSFGVAKDAGFIPSAYIAMLTPQTKWKEVLFRVTVSL